MTTSGEFQMSVISHAPAIDRELTGAVSFDITAPTEATGRSPETRRVLREMDFGTV